MAKSDNVNAEEVPVKDVIKTKKKSKKKSSDKKTKKTKKTRKVKKTTPKPVETVQTKEETQPVETVQTKEETQPVQSPEENKTAPVTTKENVDPMTSLDDNSINDTIISVVTRITELMTELKTIQSTVKNLNKLVKKERQAKSKKLNRTLNELRKKTSKKRKPSGLAKPTLLSNSLCDFLDLPTKSSEARTSVTKKINKYIADKKLQNPERKKEILPDDKLEEILKTGGSVLTYTNLQTFLNKHFANKANPVPVADQ